MYRDCYPDYHGCHTLYYIMSQYKYQTSQRKQFNIGSWSCKICLVMFMEKEEKKEFDNSERYRDIGCAIAYYRKRKQMTQEQVADLVGISRQHMGTIEAPNMVRALSLEVVFNIATVLEIEPYMLFKFNPDK